VLDLVSGGGDTRQGVVDRTGHMPCAIVEIRVVVAVVGNNQLIRCFIFSPVKAHHRSAVDSMMLEIDSLGQSLGSVTASLFFAWSVRHDHLIGIGYYSPFVLLSILAALWIVTSYLFLPNDLCDDEDDDGVVMTRGPTTSESELFAEDDLEEGDRDPSTSSHQPTQDYALAQQQQ